ncbi:MAG: MobV family relaxase [Bacteroidota bacterium]
MPFAILHTKKYKEFTLIGNHIDRLHISQNVDKRRIQYNQDLVLKEILDGKVDTLRTHLNQEIISHHHSLKVDVERRIKDGYHYLKKDADRYQGKQKLRAIRKDAVKAIGVILSGSHERMKEIEQDKELFEAWKKANYEFACREWGKSNIVRMTLHMDEKTPHFHCVFVPITPDARLEYGYYLNGANKLMSLQDRYAQAMQPFGLQRGISKAITQKKHQTTREWYLEQAQNAKKNQSVVDEQTKSIKLSNAFQLDKVRKEQQAHLLKSYAENEDLKKKNEHLRKTLSQVIEQGIKSDLERVKREVNLVQHAASMGYQIVKRKGKGNWVTMEKGADSICVLTQPNDNGHWFYKSNVDTKEKGTIIDFMKNRGYSYEYIRRLGSAHLDQTPLEYLKKITPKVSEPDIAEQVAVQKYESYSSTRDNNYLQKRGIRADIIEEMKVKANTKGALFALESNGKLCSTIEYTDRGKYFQAGLPRGVCIVGKRENPDFVVITESPVDALSYEQMRYDQQKTACNTLYVATCGSPSKEINKEIVRVTTRYPHAQIVCAFDNDEAGKKMSMHVKELLEGKRVLVHKPKFGKDFNDMLLALTNKLENPSKARPERDDDELEELIDTQEARKRQQKI